MTKKLLPNIIRSTLGCQGLKFQEIREPGGWTFFPGVHYDVYDHLSAKEILFNFCSLNFFRAPTTQSKLSTKLG